MGLLSLALVLAGVALWAFQAPPPPTEPLQIGGDFTLISDAGEPVNTAEAFAGRPMLVTFGYTSCPDICPRGACSTWLSPLSRPLSTKRWSLSASTRPRYARDPRRLYRTVFRRSDRVYRLS